MEHDRRPPLWKRKYIVDPALQWEITGYFVGTMALILGILLWGSRSLLRDTLKSLSDLGAIPGNPAYELVNAQFSALNQLFLLDAVVGFAAVLIGGILLSHRVAGPIFRLRLTLEKLLRGEKVLPLQFRKGDYFLDLAETLTRLAERHEALEGKRGQASDGASVEASDPAVGPRE